ncbi:MAG: cell wall-binding repeat-containing protein [Acidimicrobiales bacterium]
MVGLAPIAAAEWSPAQAGAATSSSTWTELSPSASPSARVGALTAYNPTTGNVVLFGGDSVTPAGPGEIAIIGGLSDTWTWNGTTWTQLSPPNTPDSADTMAYDPATGNIVLVGFGSNNDPNNDATWTWNGTTWTQLNPPASPPERFGASMAYDPATGNIVLFGGTNTIGLTSQDLNDTWTWNGNTWTQASPLTSPSPRAGASMAYDASSGNLVLFGGEDDDLNRLGDTWTWNGTDWTEQSPSVNPSPGSGAMTEDPVTGDPVLFAPDAKTWTWNAGNWTQQSSTTSPSERVGAAVIGDPATGNVVLFGGLSLAQDNFGGLNDTWTWSQNAASGVVRIYGTDAIGTAIAISQARFPEAGSAGAVVLARSDYFSDALAGGPLAAKLDAPLLLTPGASLSASLDPRVLTEIQRVLPAGGTIYVLGGNLALSPSIDTTLTGLGFHVVREAGADQYATAVDIAEAIGDPSTIFEASGLSFYDSVSAVPAAVESHGAILLTQGATQAPETAAYLAAHPSDQRYAIGGPQAAAGADPSATPVFGSDLYGTSAAVATRFFPDATTFGAATSAWFSDALAAGPFLGAQGAPILFVPPSGPLPPAISQYLATVAPGLTGGTLFGGPLAVGNDVLADLDAAL